MGNKMIQMKKASLVLEVVFLPLMSSLSQDFPIPANGAEWNNTIIQAATMGPTQGTSRIEIKGDTIINDIAYSKLFTTLGSSYYQTGQCEFHLFGSGLINRYEGAIRTDENYKVSYFPQGETDSIILYDFSLSVGDSVLISESNNPYYAYVLEIDTILIANSPRKQLTMKGMYGWDDIWIEGIGSLYGLLTTEFRLWEFHDYELTCYEENDIPLYTSTPSCTRCDIATFTNPENTQESISIYPNPVIGRSVIDWAKSFFPKQLNIYDLFGKTIFSKSVVNTEELYIDRKDLAKGVLVLELVGNNRNTYRQQFIVL